MDVRLCAALLAVTAALVSCSAGSVLVKRSVEQDNSTAVTSSPGSDSVDVNETQGQ